MAELLDARSAFRRLETRLSAVVGNGQTVDRSDARNGERAQTGGDRQNLSCIVNLSVCDRKPRHRAPKGSTDAEQRIFSWYGVLRCAVEGNQVCVVVRWTMNSSE